MKFKNIEVNGIVTVVFNREVEWKHLAISNDWIRTDEGRVIAHNTMMWIIRKLMGDHRYRMWVHQGTLNVVKK